MGRRAKHPEEARWEGQFHGCPHVLGVRGNLHLLPCLRPFIPRVHERRAVGPAGSSCARQLVSTVYSNITNLHMTPCAWSAGIIGSCSFQRLVTLCVSSFAVRDSSIASRCASLFFSLPDLVFPVKRNE